MTRRVRVAAIAGDGIGQEVLPPTIPLIDAAAALDDLEIDWLHLDWSTDSYLRDGVYIPVGGMDLLRSCQAIYFGAVGDPRVPDQESLWGLLLTLRQQFAQSVNLRPIQRLATPSPLRSNAEFDILLVRENVEGEYTSIGGRMSLASGDDIAMQVSVFSRHESLAVARCAFERARVRRKSVVAATKSNALVHTMVFWEEAVREVAEEFPDISLRFCHVDALAAEFLLKPEKLDVVVASNLFADILADIGAAIMGSIGLAPSANIDPTSTAPSLFEPVHGSAPDIAGKGIANPTGQLLTGAMLLEFLGAGRGASSLRLAVSKALGDPAFHTRDVGGSASTGDVVREVGRQLGLAAVLKSA